MLHERFFGDDDDFDFGDEDSRGDAVVSAPPAGNEYEGEGAICLVWDPAGQLLCVTRPEPPHEMAIPGGHIEPGETPLHAAVRELREEVKILVRSLDHVATIRSPLDGRRVYVFRATKWRGVPRAVEAGTEIAWLTPEELLVQSETFAASVRELRDAGLLRRPLAPGGGIARQLNPPVREDAESQLWREDAIAREVIDVWVAGRQDADAARAVYEQLLNDYHAEDLDWVLDLQWEGPRAVPLEEINFSDRARWRASHDGTLQSYIEKIREGRLKPIILVQPPESLFDVVDGHHRTLANEALGRSPLAYVARVPSVDGEWRHLHSLQKKGSSKTGEATASRPGSRGEARAEPDELAEQYAEADRADQQAFAFARGAEKLLNPRGERGRYSEQDATQASRMADGASGSATDVASHLEAAKAHSLAARAHRVLAEPHGRKGNKKASAKHLEKAQEHDRRAGEHILEATTPAAARGDGVDVEDARSPDAKAAWKLSGALERQVDLEQTPEDHLEAARLHRAAAASTPAHATTHNEKAAYHEQMASRLGEHHVVLQRTAARAGEAAEASGKAADHVAAAKAWRSVEAHPQTGAGMRSLASANAGHHEGAAEEAPDWDESKHPRDEGGRFT